MAHKSEPNAELRDTVTHKAEPRVSSRSKDARALRSASALRDGLLTLLERKAFDQISVRDICAQSGVHYATFFRHFDTKAALLDGIATDQIVHLVELTMAIRAHDNYHAGFRALCQYVDDHRALWSTLLNGGAGAAMREEWQRQSRLVAEREGPVNSWLPSDLGSICAASLIAETLAWWVAQPADVLKVDEVAAILFRLLTSSIVAPD